MLDSLSILYLRLMHDENTFMNTDHFYILTKADLLTTGKHLKSLWEMELIDVRKENSAEFLIYEKNTLFPLGGYEYRINLNGIAYLENIDTELKKAKKDKFRFWYASIVSTIALIVSILVAFFK